MTTQNATDLLFDSAFVLIDGHVGRKLREANLRLHWGSQKGLDATYYMAHYAADDFPYPEALAPKLERRRSVEGTLEECKAEWNVWVDNWETAPRGQAICVKLGNSRGHIKPTSYRLMFHLSQCLLLAKGQLRTPSNVQLVKLLERLTSQLVDTQEAVVGVF